MTIRTKSVVTSTIGAAVALAVAACVTAPRSSGGATAAPQVDAVLQQISARRIEASVRTLAGFGTRHTLSETTSDTRGVRSMK